MSHHEESAGSPACGGCRRDKRTAGGKVGAGMDLEKEMGGYVLDAGERQLLEKRRMGKISLHTEIDS